MVLVMHVIQSQGLSFLLYKTLEKIELIYKGFFGSKILSESFRWLTSSQIYVIFIHQWSHKHNMLIKYVHTSNNEQVSFL